MNQDTKQDLLCRLRSIEGHVRGVARMVEYEAPCLDILHQLTALRGSIDRLEGRLLEAHLRDCLPRQLTTEAPRAYEEALQEVIAVLLRRAARGSRGTSLEDTSITQQEVNQR